ncbi:MAG: hypothetical protein OEN50_10420 [Deltaproteobacteria bacterium]|nr:hypothetical protein [Deltaproteobacteria bacterium]
MADPTRQAANVIRLEVSPHTAVYVTLETCRRLVIYDLQYARWTPMGPARRATTLGLNTRHF